MRLTRERSRGRRAARWREGRSRGDGRGRKGRGPKQLEFVGSKVLSLPWAVVGREGRGKWRKGGVEGSPVGWRMGADRKKGFGWKREAGREIG